MPDDYSPNAVAGRLEHAAQAYENRGEAASALEARVAADAARQGGSDMARRIETDFNGGHRDYSGTQGADTPTPPAPSTPPDNDHGDDGDDGNDDGDRGGE